MRINLWCMVCSKKGGTESFQTYPAELQDDGRYRMTCAHGHETITFLQEQKFELLFDLAINAIIDGYYREAVSSFTSALERFYEFYLRVISTKYEIDKEEFKKLWGQMKSQSERQLGAFLMLFLRENSVCPPTLTDKNVSYRNSVIHKGKIPTREEAIKFGENVFSIIVPILTKLKTEEWEWVSFVTGDHVKKTHAIADGQGLRVGMSIPTCISISIAVSEPQPSLGEWLEHLTNHRHRI